MAAVMLLYIQLLWCLRRVCTIAMCIHVLAILSCDASLVLVVALVAVVCKENAG
jgi:hypothetical protein